MSERFDSRGDDGHLRGAGPQPTRDLSATVRHSKRRRGRANTAELGPALPLATGSFVNQYQILRELGRGAMGWVFLGWDHKLCRQVAIKFFDQSAYDVGERFLIEGRATARCRHENIVTIYEVGELHGQRFLVLEYLEGASLSTLLGRGPLAPEQVIALIVPVVRALVCAHASGIVHRDLKPDNIVMTDDGRIKVLDFGIAKMTARPAPHAGLDPREPSSRRPDTPGVTAHGTMLGTLPYMAPEQWASPDLLSDDHVDGRVDGRTDIWAVGILLFEMLCGQHPLAPLSTRSLATTPHLDRPMPAVRDVAPDVPPVLARIVDECLQKPLARRLGSARALLERLLDVAPGPRPGARASELLIEQCPYPGPVPLGERDASRFFGRFWEAARVATLIRDEPLVGVIGAPGVGKSSLVRAGVIPALRSSHEPWETLVLRPGRRPLSALASRLAWLLASGPSADSTVAPGWPDVALMRQRLSQVPESLLAMLKQIAHQRTSQVLLFVDPLDTLYDADTDQREREELLACLDEVAQSAGSRVRMVVAMRADALARASREHVFFRRIGRAMEHVAPMDRTGLLQALLQPAAMCGYDIEPPVAEALIASIERRPDALLRLQQAAVRMWAARDRERRRMGRDLADARALHDDRVPPGE